MYIQYVGSDNSISSRIYTFHVIDPPGGARDFTVKIRSEEFCPGRLKYQDGPGISSARLQRELEGETQESRAKPDLCIDEQDIREYRAQQYPQQKPSKRTDAKPGPLSPKLPRAPTARRDEGRYGHVACSSNLRPL
jgi:hypothetical protein